MKLAVAAIALTSGFGLTVFAAQMGDGTGTHSVEVPVPQKGTTPKEVSELLDTNRLRAQQIVLRGKTVLPPHAAKEHVVVVAMTGQGIVEAGGKQLKLDARHFVVLAPNVTHRVVPETETLELLLLRQPATRGGRGPGAGRRR